MTNTELQKIVARLSKKKAEQSVEESPAPAPPIKKKIKKPVESEYEEPIQETPEEEYEEEAEEEGEESDEDEEVEEETYEEPEPTPAPAPRPILKKKLQKAKVIPKARPSRPRPVEQEQPEVSVEEIQLAQQIELLQNDGRFRYLLLNELQKLNSGIYMLYREISKVTGGKPDAEEEATE